MSYTENRLVDRVGEGEGGMNWETSMETYIIICKIDSQWEFGVWHRELSRVLCDNLEQWDGEKDRRGFRKGTYVYLWLIYVDVWQKPTQYCKAIVLQFKKIKNNLFPWLKGDRLDLTCDLDLEELSLLRTSGKNKWVLGCGFLRMVLLFMCYYVSVSYKISFSKKYPMLEKVGKPLDWNHCFLSALTHSDSSTSSDKKGECLLKQPKAPNYNT